MKFNAQKRGTYLVAAAATLWGTTGTAQAFAPSGATPPVVGALRLVLGGLVLLVIAQARGAFAQKIRWPIKATVLAAFFMAAYQVLFFGGVARTGVAVGTIVGIGSSPIIGGVLGYLFRGERPGWSWLVATLMAISGAGLLAATGESLQVDIIGLILAIGAGAAYAAFTLFSKSLLDDRPPEAVQAVVFLLGSVFLLPILLIGDLSWIFQLDGILVVLHLGVITVGLAYSLFGQGLRLVPVSTAVTLTLAEPMTAGILGLLVLGERVTFLGFVGIALIFSGLAVLTVGRRTEFSVD